MCAFGTPFSIHNKCSPLYQDCGWKQCTNFNSIQTWNGVCQEARPFSFSKKYFAKEKFKCQVATLSSGQQCLWWNSTSKCVLQSNRRCTSTTTKLCTVKSFFYVDAIFLNSFVIHKTKYKGREVSGWNFQEAMEAMDFSSKVPCKLLRCSSTSALFQNENCLPLSKMKFLAWGWQFCDGRVFKKKATAPLALN